LYKLTLQVTAPDHFKKLNLLVNSSVSVSLASRMAPLYKFYYYYTTTSTAAAATIVFCVLG